MRFRAVLELHGKTATGMQVPDEVVAALGSSRRPAVRVTINGYTYRSSVAVMGGVFMLGVSAENRAGAGVAAGDVLDVDLELDTEPREVEVPADLAAALDAEPRARAAYEALTYSNKRALVMSVEGAKTDETRQRRIAKSVTALLSD
jgi:Bacteriocin-protection, YdeI or OmpD-Associated/Domain of unknown function (DUF1905)